MRAVARHRAGWGRLAVVAVVLAAGQGAAWAQAGAAAPTGGVLPELVMPALPPGAPAPVPAGRPLTLAQAVEIALRNQPQLGAAVAAAQAAAGRTRQTESGRGPSVSVSAQGARSGTEQTVGGVSVMAERSSFSTDVSARQLIYDFGATNAQVAQARSRERASGQTLAQTRQDVINQVKQSYYRLLGDQRLLQVQRENVANQQAHLELARGLAEGGIAPRSDVVRAETAVAEAVLNLARAQNTAALSLVNLNLALGVDVRTPTQVEQTEEAAAGSGAQADLVALALGQRPEARAARFSLQAAREALGLAQVSNRPSVFGEASYGLRGSAVPPSDRNWSFGAGVQWPLFDSGLTRGRVQEAAAQVRSAEASLRQVEQTVGSEVVGAYLDLQTAEQQVVAAGAEVTNAQESLRAATGRYAAGRAAYIEVIDAQNALVTAQTNQVNALYTVSTSRAALKRALGLEEGR